MKTIVKVHCRCTDGPSAKFQDQQYGKGVRLATVSQKSKEKSRPVRCTVCGATHIVNVE